MKAIALFNNKGGVGKTSLAYHLGFMFAELGRRVLLADLDPQSNLTSMCLSEARLETSWSAAPRRSIHGAVERLRRGVADVDRAPVEQVSARVGLVPGDLRLSEFEDDLSLQWPRCLDRDERAFRVTTALHRVVRDGGAAWKADLIILDIGPNFGAINRSALLAADHVIVPVAPDLFSVEALKNVGPRLDQWRTQWGERRQRAPAEVDFDLPSGAMEPLGYIVGRHTTFAGGPVRAFQRWLDRLPDTFRQSFGLRAEGAPSVDADPYCLATLKDYRSLMPMAQEARKPLFLLKPGDGAIGGHQGAVREAYEQFEKLARSLLGKTGLLASGA